MELKDFISETLSQLVEGVIDAQSKLKDTGGSVCPPVQTPAKSESLYGHAPKKEPVFLVNFDIGIEASDSTQTKGGIGVAAGLFALGSQGQSNKNNQSFNKIQFSIPVAFPLQRTEKNN